jgi:hypothetical protein
VSNLSAGLLVLAAVGLGRAIQINYGFYDSVALGWLTGALFLTLAALVPGRRRTAWAVSPLIPTVLLGAGLIWQYWMLLTAQPAMYIRFRRPSEEPTFFAMLIAAAILSVAVVFGSRRSRRVAFVLVLALQFGLGAWMLRASPNPRIDVVTVHREALHALKDGRSPYSITFENIYGRKHNYAPGLTSGARVLFGLPYPPLSLLMAAPGQWLAGDYRFASLAALTAGGALIALCGWRRGANGIAERQASLAALLLLFTPRVFFQLEQGWTEPFMILLLAATVATADTPASRPIAGLLLAAKQYLVVLLPLMPLLWPRATWRRAVQASAIAAGITLPFLVWDPQGFLKSVVFLQLAEPFRTDSLSYLAWAARNGLGQPAAWVTLLAAAVAIALALWKLPRTASGFSAAVALVLLVSFAFGKKAFCNYYFFVIAALTTAVAAAHMPPEQEEP